MSPLYSSPLAVSLFPTLLASATSQAMLVAAAVGAGVLAWVVWNALHSAPVAKYDPWENDRAFGPRDNSATRPSDTFGDAQFGAAASPNDPSEPTVNRGAGGNDAGSTLARPVSEAQCASGEAGTVGSSQGDWKASTAETSDEVRAMLREIEDPETRRMLAESLKQLQGGESE